MIKLPDFIQSAHYKRLRMEMGANEDAEYQALSDVNCLTHEEAEELSTKGLSIDASMVNVCDNQTLQYKNQSVWLLHASDSRNYHLGQCPLVRRWRISRNQVLIGTHRFSGSGMTVCRECLRIIGYKGISVRELKRRGCVDQLYKGVFLNG
jgi:hypothetical protein